MVRDHVLLYVVFSQTFEEDLASRAAQMESVQRTGKELEAKATPNDAATIQGQLLELKGLWDKVSALSRKKSVQLEDALKEVRTWSLCWNLQNDACGPQCSVWSFDDFCVQAEQLHKAVHMLLEWLSDAEMKLRFAGPLPEDEQETRNQLAEHDK